MNIHMTLGEAAKRLAPSGDDANVRAFAELLENAARAGQLDVTLEREPRPFPVIIGGSSGRAESQAPKTINWYSRVDFAEACLWSATHGYTLPDSALNLLPRETKAKLLEADRVTTARGVQDAKAQSKALQIAGVMLIVLGPHLPPAYRHRGGINAQALVEKIIEHVQGTDGQPPHGWGASSLASWLKDAISEGEALMKSRG